MTKTVSKIARSKHPADKSDPKTRDGARSANPYSRENFLGDEEFVGEDRGTDDRGHRCAAGVGVEAEEDLEADIDMEADPESAAGPVTGDDDQIDDPIRIYLMQMGEIPLLEPGGRDRGRAGRSSAPAAASATSCWPPTTCCTRRSRCSRASATAARGWTARSRSR